MPRAKELYIHMPFVWFELAAELPGKALVIATLIWHQAKLNGNAGPLVLRSTFIGRCGLDRKTVAGGLRVLEDAELIRVDRKRGAKPRITVAPHWWVKYDGARR
jgi:hypothetical protein